jgi:hypothetical protein
MSQKDASARDTPVPLPPVYNLYFDDTGTRRLDRLRIKPNEQPPWFALGGVLVASKDEELCKSQYRNFYAAWPQLNSPLHITDMRARRGGFSWLERISGPDQTKFWKDYYDFLAALPVIGIACVIHRPGYLARGYGSREGDKAWNLCRSAFNILIERSSKFCLRMESRLRVKFEGCDKLTDEAIKQYFILQKAGYGTGFSTTTSAKYGPLAADQMKAILIDIERKDKSSTLMQIADSYVYAMAKGKYEPSFDLFQRLSADGRLMSGHVPSEEIEMLGIKYYCFD